jgi:hypothetical protein
MPSPTGLSASQQKLDADTVWNAALATGVLVGAVGVGITATGVALANPAAIMIGVPMAVEGITASAVLLAGGKAKDAVDVHKGFDYKAIKIVETVTFMVVESAASQATNKQSGKAFADNLKAAKDLVSLTSGKLDVDSLAESIDGGLSLLKYAGEKVIKDAEPQSEQAQEKMNPGDSVDRDNHRHEHAENGDKVEKVRLNEERPGATQRYSPKL